MGGGGFAIMVGVVRVGSGWWWGVGGCCGLHLFICFVFLYCTSIFKLYIILMYRIKE